MWYKKYRFGTVGKNIICVDIQINKKKVCQMWYKICRFGTVVENIYYLCSRNKEWL